MPPSSDPLPDDPELWRAAEFSRKDYIKAYADSRIKLIERAFLMMILRGGFPSNGWRLCVVDEEVDGYMQTQAYPLKPGESPPHARCWLLGRQYLPKGHHD